MGITRLQTLLYVIGGLSLVSMVFAATNTTAAISSTLCGFITGVQTIIGVLALALFLIGGVLYAIAHFLPTSLDYRKNLIGWSTAMIVGGIIGLIVVIIAYPLVTTFTHLGTAINGTAVSNISCS
ncbi:MAG: hypothetical protein M1286_01190 [Candidatus Marsarchaeota archaeon]|nr:hypothetical protein [Candidatus Marsarchaeota archaeon]